jgi:hypothetical protein
MKAEDMVIGKKYRRIVFDWDDDIKIGTVLTLAEIVSQDSARFVEFPRMTLMPKFFEPVEEGAVRAGGGSTPWSTHDIYDDVVNHPKHYTSKNGVECIDVVEQFNYNRGNIIKYAWRAGEKDPNKEIEDLEKCKWYAQREIERLLKGAKPSC